MANSPSSSNRDSQNSTSPGAASPQPPRDRSVRKARSRFSDEYGVLLHRLIELRKQKGVTQVEIARRLGKTQSHVSMCENREREIGIIDLWKWCEALDTRLSDFCQRFEVEVGQQR